MKYVQYVTSEGDRWDLIAYKAYGDVSKMNAIIQANPLTFPLAVLPAGLTLRIPVLEGTDLISPELLPPWKRL